MRISLRDIFVIMAFAAVMSWCAAEARVDNSLFWFVALVAAGLSVFFVVVGKRQHGRWLTLLAPLVVFFFLILPLASSLLINVLLAFLIAALICTFLPPLKVRTLCAIAMACVAGSFVWTAIEGRARVLELATMKREFPVVSLASRLQYERPSSSPAGPAISPGVAKELADFEQQCDRGLGRAWELTRIHSREYEHFIRASGFGMSRMREPTLASLRMEPIRDIAFGEQKRRAIKSPTEQWLAAWEDRVVREVPELHSASRNDFLDPNGFGAVMKPFEQVAGFIAHALHVPTESVSKNEATLAIERLELVSLLKFDEPRVYVLDHLPRMDQLSSDEAPTRPLDEFESSALEQLQTEQDVVVKEEAGRYRMLGSLRATKQCLDCHSVQRGELLGAFTYFLREMPAEMDEGESADLTDLSTTTGQ